ncbi:hypothetical protein K4L06_02755 [Lysobacter sp. BMK333-48F3]|uniref:hypothetical protein n=1 Tax=Lysobacter sp. BMK333-48F3 TaxID=2867962 RepID=UPI001C8BF3D9|nr:hypothetical protein [Lysobacter sp. BMK333-48F3]MBX9400214.1 hypothetical protein [Lysobacter sp. BMK333-48F3]
MRVVTLQLMAAAIALTCASTASATPPVIFGKYGVRSVTIGFHTSIPTDCASASIFAANEWNAAGADFDLKTTTTSHARFEDQPLTFDYQNVTVQDGAPPNPNAIMTARVKRNTTTGIIENADIIVDQRRINQTGPQPVDKLNCAGLNPTPVNEVDFHSAVLHELGHVVGLEDVLDEPSCALYYSLPSGVRRRALCASEKQAHIANYGKRFQIVSIPNVTGPQGVNIPAQIHYEGTPTFPVQRNTKIIQCASGWTCSDYNGTYSSATPSPLNFNFRCGNSSSLPTATFLWRTTLTDAKGVVTNAVEHTSTCTSTTGARGTNATPKAVNRVIITN